MYIIFRYLFLFLFIAITFCDEQAEEVENRVVKLDVGEVRGEKYWGGDFFEFYGVPYATVPKGRDRFKAPQPLEPFGSLNADIKYIKCPQVFLTQENDGEVEVHGQEDCLTMNILVPKLANENNLVPVLVYIHSGAYSGGDGNMGRLHYLARHDVIVISFNYRLGAIGFACLGTEDIPGNAALKDQVEALRFINKYIRKFGGDPNKVTLAGFSVGATMAELLALSKSATGLIDKLILESGSALSPFAVDRNPIDTAKNLAKSIGYNDTGNIKDLNEFLLNTDVKTLAINSMNFYLRNSTFGLAPCIENAIGNNKPFMTESPLAILQRGDYKKIPVLTGFANMEGISRTFKFDEWSEEMNENFGDFLPADLKFETEKLRDVLVENVRKYYFKGEEVTHDTIKEYVDYFSDSMFKYSIMKSAMLHARSDRPVFLYEFTYVGKLSMKHYFMDKLDGASHRDQTSYLWDFFEFTTDLKDMDTRDRMTTMWTDFVKYEDPTAYESLIIDVKWPRFSRKEPNYIDIGKTLKLKTNLFSDRYAFWDKIYDEYYWTPTPVEVPKKKIKK